MKKAKKKKSYKKKDSHPKKDRVENSNVKLPQKKQGKQKPVKQVKQKPVGSIQKKGPEKKKADDRGILGQIDKARQFLREAKMELKKVKWPTKKELLASTAVVIFLTLVMALYFGLVDFGLIKIIKGIVQ